MSTPKRKILRKGNSGKEETEKGIILKSEIPKRASLNSSQLDNLLSPARLAATRGAFDIYLGSTGDCEEDTDRASPDQYKSVSANVTNKDNKKKTKKGPDASNSYDELAIGSSDVWMAKRRRW